MKVNTSIILFISILYASGCLCQSIQMGDISIGIFIQKETVKTEPEFKALYEYMENLNLENLSVITPKSILKKPDQLEGKDIIWVYKNDTLPFKPTNSHKIFSTLTRFVEKGGKIILANQALAMVPSLGLDDLKPETRIKQIIDEGYGRQLGYHAFRRHRLFEGMNGGAYVLKPLKDTVVMQTGYFGYNKPCNGKVIGVDWDYIFLREESKLIIEYNLGKGKVLGIGGYLLYSLPNRNRIHLETFTKNIFRYLTEENPDVTNFYWNYDTSTVIRTPFQISQPLSFAVSKKFPELESKLSIKPGKSTGNYWDLAGERMLLMGEDHGGIREIWAHPMLCLRDYKVTYSFEGTVDTLLSLNELHPEIEIFPATYIRLYDLTGDLTGDLLDESITLSPNGPYAVIHYDYQGNIPVNLDISFRMLFRLMWPYSEKVLGNLYYSWNDDLQAFIANGSVG